MVNEVLESLQIKGLEAPGVYVDCTVGEGGHSESILNSTRYSKILGIDMDPEALKVAKRRLEPYGERFVAAQANFSDVEKVVKEHGFMPVNGIMFDLGISSLQLESTSRGFSFLREAALDMRFNPNQRLTASTLVNDMNESDLADVIFHNGGEHRARQIVRSILRARPISTTTQLADIVARAAGGRRGRRHPATKTFQALRMVVNNEMGNLESGINGAIRVLSAGGRFVSIAYHSLEDRLVKTSLINKTTDYVCQHDTPKCECAGNRSLELVRRRVIKPTAEEIRLNPRSRSAKMRVATRI